MMFKLDKLPYAEDALEPHISAATMALHHGKHHQAYIDTLNTLLEGDAMAGLALDEVVQQSHGLAARQTVFKVLSVRCELVSGWRSYRRGCQTSGRNILPLSQGG